MWTKTPAGSLSLKQLLLVERGSCQKRAYSLTEQRGERGEKEPTWRPDGASLCLTPFVCNEDHFLSFALPRKHLIGIILPTWSDLNGPFHAKRQFLCFSDSFEETKTKKGKSQRRIQSGKRQACALKKKSSLNRLSSLLYPPWKLETNCKCMLLQTDMVSGTTQTDIPTCNAFPTHTHKPKVKVNPSCKPAGLYPHFKFPNKDDFHHKAACRVGGIRNAQEGSAKQQD